jgi:hypothetical protein
LSLRDRLTEWFLGVCALFFLVILIGIVLHSIAIAEGLAVIGIIVSLIGLYRTLTHER